MTTDYVGARNSIFAMLNEALTGADAVSILGKDPVIVWQNKLETSPPSNNFWARVTLQIADESQATLSTYEGVAGQKMYNSAGLVFVQTFAPKGDATAPERLLNWALLVRNAFRGIRSGSVTYSNSKLQELPPEQLYFRFNVVSQFEFSEII